MASFNLGRIKGDKGDKGEMGPKGDTGLKGDKGEKGDNGKDGMTPVFSVGETHTLSSSEEAYVELDTKAPENPVLSFYIPRGKDGKDASGDMLSSVYDTKGIGKDIYEYVQTLTDNCIKTSGGTLSGALKAAESSLPQMAVRNICIASDLPESAAEGDICIIRKETSKKLGECNPGDIMLIEEYGKEVPYMVVASNYHGDNTVTLVRKYFLSSLFYFDFIKRGQYLSSDMDVLLESIHKSAFPESVRKHLKSIEITERTKFERQCFLLSEADFQSIEYFKTKENRVTGTEEGSGSHYVTRTVNSKANVVTIDAYGSITTQSQSNETWVRPAIVLPADLAVENADYEGTAAVKMPETNKGIYTYVEGEWKECASL